MNYLAHAYLSFNQPNILIGNLISDFVKGKQKFSYSTNIQKGIQLHRLIDSFTDMHEITAQAKQYFKPVVGLYAGAFVDVVYDHFLAIDATIFENQNALQNFANNCYCQLQNNILQLPQSFATILPYMQQKNWLYNYQFIWGIQKSFQGVVKRATYLSNSTNVFTCFLQHYQQFKICYDNFFPQLKNYTTNQLQLLQNV